MKIKFMLAINENGEWAVAGWNGATDFEMCEALDTVFEEGFHTNTHSVEVEVPVPNAKLVGEVVK